MEKPLSLSVPLMVMSGFVDPVELIVLSEIKSTSAPEAISKSLLLRLRIPVPPNTASPVILKEPLAGEAD